MGFLKWSGGFEGLERRRGWNGFDPLRDRRAETSRNLAGGALSGTGKSGENGRSAESQFAQAIGSKELVARIPRRSPDWNKRNGCLGKLGLAFCTNVGLRGTLNRAGNLNPKTLPLVAAL